MSKLFEIMPLFYYDVAAVIVFFMLYITLNTKSLKQKERALYLMCIINFVSYLINDYYFYIRGSHILTLLPFQLCNIAVFLVPIAVMTKKQLLLDFVFYVCALGAFAALLIPSRDYLGITYSLMTISFFIFHFMIAAIPFLMMALGMYNPMPTIKKAINLSAAVLVLAGSMHMLNLILGVAFNAEANYFFTIIKYSAHTNPAFEMLSKIIPYDFFYLLPALVVLYIYMGTVFMIESIGGKYFRTVKNTSKSSGS